MRRLTKSLAAGLLVAGAVALIAPKADAYVVLKRWDSGNTTKWTTNTVKWSISSNLMSDVTPEQLDDALKGAIQSWANVSCATLSFSFQGYQTWDPGDGIHITFKENNWDPSVGDALAYSVSESNSSGTIFSNDVVFNAVDAEWSTVANGAPGKNDIEGVAAHELGHSVGLDHSRHFESTMFFSGGSTELRTLSADDQRGLCFLYPSGSFTDARGCDSCEGTPDCSDGYCWNWGGGHAFCLDTCSTDSDCPTGFSCATLDSTVAKQCYPDNENCEQIGSNVALGQPCYGHEVCQSGLCLVTGSEAFCTKECSSASQCGSGFNCSQGLCFPAGSKPIGADCTADSECATAACLDFGSDQICTSYCGSAGGGSCPSGQQCYQDIACIPPGPRPNGAQCLSPTQCLGTYCEGAKCTQPCNASQPCPTGTTCLGGFCDGPGTGGQCVSGSDCATGLICRYPAVGATSGSCEWDCNSLSGLGCPAGQVCKWRWEAWSSSIKGNCAAANNGAGPGESCASGPCEADLVCHEVSPGDPLCLKDCKLNANNLGCSVNEICEDRLQDPNDPVRGLCVDKFYQPPTSDAGGTPELGPPPDLGAPPVDAGPIPVDTGGAAEPIAATDLGGPPQPDVKGGGSDSGVIVSADMGVVMIPGGGSSGPGCSADAPGRTPLALLLGLALWGLLAWRRRARPTR